MPLLDTLKDFRNKIYSCFTARSDANMNILDALASYGHQCKSIVELSEAPFFERQYTSYRWKNGGLDQEELSRTTPPLSSSPSSPDVATLMNSVDSTVLAQN